MIRIRHIIFAVLFSTLFLTSCVKDDLLFEQEADAPATDAGVQTRVDGAEQGLVRDGSGQWRATRRVPLVGCGRIIDNYANALVAVLAGSANLEAIIDTDLSNGALLGGVATVDLAVDEIFSVKDLHHTYAAGQKVGFVVKKDGSGVLGLEVLKGFTVFTYLNNQKQESFGWSEGGKLLGLNLISIAKNNGLHEVSFEATKPFDEVGFAMAGVADVSVLKTTKILYAFVGENPKRYATMGGIDYPNTTIFDQSGWTGGALYHTERIVDNTLTNYAYTETLSGLIVGLGKAPCVTVHFGEMVPAGSEVGYEFSENEILNLELFSSGLRLQTYDDTYDKKKNPDPLDEVRISDLVGLSLLTAGKKDISMKVTKPFNRLYFQIGSPGVKLDLGQVRVYAAYTRDPIIIDQSSYFSMPGTITIKNNHLYLPAPKNGSTHWMVKSKVAESNAHIETDADGRIKVTGLNKNGEYVVSGVCTLEDGRTAYAETHVIRKAVDPGTACNRLIGTNEHAAIATPRGVDFGVNILVGEKDRNNIVDDNPDNYATWVEPVSLVKNNCIVAVDCDPISPAKTGNTKLRAGFTLQTTFDVLSADLLNFYIVKLYNGNTKVADSSNKEVSTLKVSLIGSRSDKFRVYVETDREFDHLELWSSGVLKIGLTGRRVFNAFWESADEGVACPAAGVAEAGLEFLNYDEHGARINYEESKLDKSLVGVKCTYSDVGEFLDNSKKTYSLSHITGIADANMGLAMKVNPLRGRRTIGVMMDKPLSLNVDLLSVMTMNLYCRGQNVHKVGKGELLNLNVIGNDGLQYVETKNPVDVEFDEIRIGYSGVAQVLNLPRYYGVYTRSMTDGDIPGGGENNPDSGGEDKEELSIGISPNEICENETLNIKCLKGTKPGLTYTVSAYNENNNKTYLYHDHVPDAEGVIRISDLKSGNYFVEIYQSGNSTQNSNTVAVCVHPLRTTWKRTAVTDNWHSWDNWTDGVPAACTDVVIPGGCTIYPVLDEGKANVCGNIHFGAYAELVNAHLLDYRGRVWVDMTILAGADYMISAPLGSMVTGDMFVPAKFNGDHTQEKYFTKLTPITSPENRFSPRIYQRFWSSEVNGKILKDGSLTDVPVETETDGVICSMTGWTRTFNAVAEPYLPAVGFVMRVERETLNSNVVNLRFPKTHKEYSYFDGSGNNTGMKETVTRDNSLGHFIFENCPTWDKTRGEGTFTVTNLKPSTVFVTGNPFMSHIVIDQFLRDNQSLISEVKFNDGNEISSVKIDEKGNILRANPHLKYIAPMQGFYVVARKEMTSLSLRFSAKVQIQKSGYSNLAARTDLTRSTAVTRGVGSSDELRITATADGFESSCLVRMNRTADNGYKKGEDSKMLYDRESAPAVAVFTLSDGYALDIQQVAATTDRIALGLRLEHPRTVTLSISRSESGKWRGWALLDTETGRRYPLADRDTHIELSRQSSSINRYCLVKL